MPFSINNSSLALQASTALTRVTNDLSQSFERLSTGLRINHASDDAAGNAVAQRTNGDAVVYTQAIENVNNGINYLNIAEDAVSTLKDIVSSLSELADKAKNSTSTTAQRTSYNTEFQNLVTEYNRVVTSTEYNYSDIFTSTNNSISVQAGYSTNGTVTANLVDSGFDTNGTGAVGASSSYVGPTGSLQVVSADFNEDHILDLALSGNTNNGGILLGNGNGTFKAQITYNIGSVATGLTFGDYNNDGHLDIVSVDGAANQISVALGNGNGTFLARTSYFLGLTTPRDAVSHDFNGDGYDDVAVSNTGLSSMMIYFGSSTGALSAPVSYAAYTPQGVALGDVNSDGVADLVVSSSAQGISVLLGNSNGSFKASTSYTSGLGGGAAGVSYASLGDINNDDILDVVASDSTGTRLLLFLGNGNGTFQAQTSTSAFGTTPRDSTIADINGDGNADLVATAGGTNVVSIFVGNGDGTFLAPTNSAAQGALVAVTANDFNNDGYDDIATSDLGVPGTRVYLATTATTAVTFRVSQLASGLNISTRATSNVTSNTLADTKTALDAVAGQIAAGLSRYSSTLSLVDVQSTLYADAVSKIRDIDVAVEAAKLIRNQVIQQGATAIVAQANQQPGRALDLLQNILAKLPSK